MNNPNPLLHNFNTPHHTAPFTSIKNQHFLPAFHQAIEEARADMQAIINSPHEPSFNNTIVALDFLGQRLHTIESIFFNLNSAETNQEMQEIAQKVAPLLAEFNNDVNLNQTLFHRVKTVYENHKNKPQLNPEQHTLLENTYLNFVRAGAELSDANKKTYRHITTQLSTLSLQFQQNLLAETNAYELLLTEKQDVAGLPPFVLEAAADQAQAQGKSGWLFTLQHPSLLPFLKYAENRQLRQKIYLASAQKGNQNNAHDNKKIITQIVNLQLQKAQLLGHPSHAHFVLQRRMAKSPEQVQQFINELHQASKPQAQKELAEMQQFAQQNGLTDQLQAWDWAFYAEKLQKTRFGFNEDQLKPYLQLPRVLQAVFQLAEQLYGITFRHQPNIETYHPEVKAYEAFNHNGQFLAVLYTDFHPRPSKRAGAWMTDYQAQYHQPDGTNHRPHISIVCNFTKATPTTPALLTFNELLTLLHEFGHALHGILSQCQYPSTSGTNVFWDFVELPSQIHENWAYEKQWLHTFATHYQTGEPIPESLLQKLLAAKNFLTAYATQRQLSFAMLDMAYYTRTKPLTQPISQFEAQAMHPTQLLPRAEKALLSTAFAHIFAGGYAAGYYSYKWAEVLDADAFALFQQQGIFNPQTAKSFRQNILEKGGSEHPLTLYKRFRGQEPTTQALLQREGLCPPKTN